MEGDTIRGNVGQRGLFSFKCELVRNFVITVWESGVSKLDEDVDEDVDEAVD